MKFQKEFPGEDEFAVVVESQSMDRNRQFVERLAAKLAPETNLFTDIYFKGDMASLGKKALLFAPESDFEGHAQGASMRIGPSSSNSQRQPTWIHFSC